MDREEMGSGGVHAPKDKCCTDVALVSEGHHSMVGQSEHKWINSDS